MHKKIMKKRFENLKEEENKLLKEYGWVVHYVFETNNEFNGMANIHTHGLLENFKHPDIQVVLPIDRKIVHSILVGLVEDIKKGKRIEPNKRNSEVLRGMDVYFAPYKEGEREVYRLMLPDANGKLPNEEGCDPIYQKQILEFEEYK